MDVQNNIVKNVSGQEKLIENIKLAIKTARIASMKIIYVRVTFRPGFPEISENNKSFSIIKANPNRFSDLALSEILPDITPEKNDIVVVKRRISAFTGSDLEVVLRGQQINHLVLCGISTSGVVLSTIREAADKDYKLTVLSDCCADNDEEVHNVLLTKIFPRQAEVISVRDWLKK